MNNSRRLSEMSTNSNTESQADTDRIERHRIATNDRIDLHQQGIAGWNARWERIQEDRGNRARFVETRLLVENHKLEQNRDKKLKRSSSLWKIPNLSGQWGFGPSRESKIEKVKGWENREKFESKKWVSSSSEANWISFGKKKDTTKESKSDVAARLMREDMERQKTKKEREDALLKEEKLRNAEYIASENLMKALVLEEDMMKQAGLNQRKTDTPKKDITSEVVNPMEDDYHYSEIDITDKSKTPIENTYSEPSGGWDCPNTLFAGYNMEGVEEHDFTTGKEGRNIFSKYERQLAEQSHEGFKYEFTTSTPVKPVPAIRKSVINKGILIKKERSEINKIDRVITKSRENDKTSSPLDSDNEFCGNVSNISRNHEVLDRSILRLKGGVGSEHGSPRKEGDVSLQINANENNTMQGTYVEDNTQDNVCDMEIATSIESANSEIKRPKNRLKPLDLNDINTDSELSSEGSEREPNQRKRNKCVQ